MPHPAAAFVAIVLSVSAGVGWTVTPLDAQEPGAVQTTTAPSQVDQRLAQKAATAESPGTVRISRTKITLETPGQTQGPQAIDTSEVPLFLSDRENGQTVARCYRIEAKAGYALQTTHPASGQTVDLPIDRICLETVQKLAIRNRYVMTLYEKPAAGSSVPPLPAHDLVFATQPAAEIPVLAAHRVDGGTYAVDVAIDRTGVNDWRLTNPRRVQRLCSYVTADGDSCADPGDTSRPVTLRFRNRMADRTAVVTFLDVPSARRANLSASGFNVTCSGGKCQAVLQVGPNSPATVPAILLQRAYIDPTNPRSGPIVFTVTMFEEEAELANPRGLFSLVPAERLSERSEPSVWSLAASADAAMDADLSALVPVCPAGTTCPTDPVISLITPHDDSRKGHVAGSVKLGLTQNLGSRARGEVEVLLKEGDLGGSASSPTVLATKYRLYVFAANGSVLSGGRYTFATPSRSIAVNEAGEGLTAAIRWFELSHIFKKEVPDERIERARLGLLPGVDVTDGDHSVTIVQTKELALTGTGRLSLLALRGAEELKGVDHRYYTVGGEWAQSFGRHAGGSLAMYRSQRNLNAPRAERPPDTRREGLVWLATANLTNFDGSAREAVERRGIDYTFTFQVGRGTGDNPETEEREDYIGQTQAFVPDLIFLKSLAKFIQLDPADGAIGKGLTNKTYYGVTFNHQRFSPLRWLAAALQVTDDTASQGTTVKYHHYRLNEWVLGSNHAGDEVDVEMRIESPKGLKYSVSLGAYRPGSALDRLITKTQFTIIGSLAVKL